MRTTLINVKRDHQRDHQLPKGHSDAWAAPTNTKEVHRYDIIDRRRLHHPAGGGLMGSPEQDGSAPEQWSHSGTLKPCSPSPSPSPSLSLSRRLRVAALSEPVWSPSTSTSEPHVLFPVSCFLFRLCVNKEEEEPRGEGEEPDHSVGEEPDQSVTSRFLPREPARETR